jgi:hypothetical protein
MNGRSCRTGARSWCTWAISAWCADNSSRAGAGRTIGGQSWERQAATCLIRVSCCRIGGTSRWTLASPSTWVRVMCIRSRRVTTPPGHDAGWSVRSRCEPSTGNSAETKRRTRSLTQRRGLRRPELEHQGCTVSQLGSRPRAAQRSVIGAAVRRTCQRDCRPGGDYPGWTKRRAQPCDQRGSAEVNDLATDDGARQCWATIRSGLGAGLQQPTDLDAVR